MKAKKVIRHPDSTHPSPLFSSALDLGDWVIISGQGPLEIPGGRYIEGSIEEETTMTLQHIERLLIQAGLDKSNIVKCTCYLSDLDDFEGFNQAYQSFFSAVSILPARTTVGAPLLRGIKVEIDAFAKR